MEEEEIFNSLTQNAFDFLLRGIKEFDRSPKYSVIHFCAAVEMILKARLMCEHWSLVVSKPDQANKEKFIAGDFASVTLEESRIRIRDIAGDDIGDEAYKSFRSLANHRNKMVHFFHPGLENDKQAKSQIVAEHCRSWFYLHQLLDGWDGLFHAFKKDVASADRAMKKHRQYLSTKFAALKGELDAASEQGLTSKKCRACGFKAKLPSAIDDRISLFRCLVCDYTETQVEIACPHCEEDVVIEDEGFAQCEWCGGSIDPEHIVDALTDHDKAYRSIRDGGDGDEPANCASCDGYHTVVQRGDKYFCANCFDIFTNVAQCEWCHEYGTGDMEDSYWAGCSVCEGSSGHMRDKDD